MYVKSFRHCQAENKTCFRIIGNCPIIQDAGIKKQDYISEMFAKEAKKKDWTMFQEPHIRDDNNELEEMDIVFVEENQAFVVVVTVRHKCSDASLEEAMMEKVKKYQHLHKLI